MSLIITGLSSFDVADSVFASVFSENIRGNVSLKQPEIKKKHSLKEFEAEQCRECTWLYFPITKLGI